MGRSFVFTSESVSEGHPDKMADQISDAILDAILARDSEARVACETLIKTGLVIVAGEIRVDEAAYAGLDIERIVRQVICDIGYDNAESGFDGNTCGVINLLGKQSADIEQGVDRLDPKDQGAGDQGMMFGYACNETDTLMPAPIHYAHALTKRHAHLRKSGQLAWLRPDAKSQVSLRYEDGQPCAVEAIVFSTQHAAGIDQAQIREAIIEQVLRPVLPESWFAACRADAIHINPTGKFVIGGPVGDCGLTGRKIIVDTYGGMARHGGGAFSGKDPSKVDRSAAYMGRYVAKNIVAAGLAARCEVQVSYAIGIAKPTSIYINSFGTGVIEDTKIAQLVERHFNLRPWFISEHLQLKRPVYRATASYGHFGRNEFSWEKTDMAEQLRAECAS